MIAAFKSLAWSFSQLKNNKIKTSIIIPCLIHVVLMFGLGYGLYTWLSHFFNWSPPQLPEWMSWAQDSFGLLIQLVSWLLSAMIAIGAVAFGLSLITAVAHFIASPFNGWLSSEAEEQIRPINHVQVSLLKTILLGLGRELKRFQYWLVRAIPLCIFSLVSFWVPAINILTSCLWLIFGAWMIGMQAVDYAADNNGIDFDQTLKTCKKYRFNVIALGAALMFMMLIPVLNLISMAIGVIAGTHLWAQVMYQERIQIK